MMRMREGVGAIVLVALLSLAACGEPVRCKVGEQIKDGQCVAASKSLCSAGTVKDPASGKCVPAADAGAGDVVVVGDATAEVTPDAVADADTAADAPVDVAADLDTAICLPQCATSDACGDDGCGGSCGACAGDKTCAGGVCVAPPGCISDCAGKVCGDDGCGGACGTCADPAKPVCQAGQCLAKCVPDCVGKACGADGCGGSCGTCGDGLECSKLQSCIAKGWTCDPAKFAAADQCDCNCGAVDPDCAAGNLALLGCAAGEKCAAGQCEPTVPKAWTCAKPAFGNGGVCDCGCGAPDPDCTAAGALVVGCKTGEVCSAAGACEKCKPDCTGKVCGDDGCGGTCGSCPEPKNPGEAKLACVAGKCVDGCVPTPILCKTHTCGSDGCGGSCGQCAPGAFCKSGQCAPEPGKSCQGFCKGTAPGGCSCAGGCMQKGDCCPDFVAQCTCTPSCLGKACGPDGCGGQCGDCQGAAGKPYCSPAYQCSATCTPSCQGKACGDDGCGGKCGTCGTGETCSGKGLCVPANWNCPDFYFGDDSACDCACGAPDPDCGKFALTVGCPGNAACDKATGWCKVSYCNANSQCAKPQWCVGHWPVGGALRKGVCQVPNPAAAPTGTPCSIDTDCAGGLCAGGACREPCQQDGDCGSGQACVGVPVVQALTGKPMGVVAVCEGVAKLSGACTSQKGCGPGRLCLAVVAPGTLQPVLRCGSLPSDSAEGQKCAGPGQCAVGLLCAGGKCVRACPGGDGDCPTGLKCGKAVLHGGASAASDDDVTTAACVAK